VLTTHAIDMSIIQHEMRRRERAKHKAVSQCKGLRDYVIKRSNQTELPASTVCVQSWQPATAHRRQVATPDK